MFYSHDSKRSLSRTSLFFVLLLGLTLTQGVLHAQPLKFQAGPAADLQIDNRYYKIVGQYKEAYLVICPNLKADFQLALFDKNLQPLRNLLVRFPQDQKLVHSLQNAWLVEDKIILLTHTYNRSIQYDQYHLWQMSEEGTLVRGPVEFARHRGNGIVIDPETKPVFGCSQDKKTLFAFSGLVSNYGQTNSGFQVTVVDNELETIMFRTINIPVDNQSARILEADLLDQKNGYVVLNFENLPKPGTKSSAAKIPNLALYKLSLAAPQAEALVLKTEEHPFVHGIYAKWSSYGSHLLVASNLAPSHKSGIQSIHFQKFGLSDTLPLSKHSFAIPAGFRKTAETNNKKFKDTGTPKRYLKEVMDLEIQITENSPEFFTLYGSIERINREVPTGEKQNEVRDEKATYTYYSQGNLIANGTWSSGFHNYYENPMDHIVVPKTSPSITGNLGMPYGSGNLMVYNDILDNTKPRDTNFKPVGLDVEKVSDAKTVLLHVDPRGRFNFHLPFADPTDAVRIYPKSVFRNSAGEFIFLGCNHKCKLRLIKAAY